MTILQYFRGIPRRVQAQILMGLERHWNDADVHVLQMPVGAGKSKVAEAIGYWAESWEKTTGICPNNNVLLKQYEDKMPELAYLRGGWDYWCKTWHQPCAKTKARKKYPCKECPHYAAVQKAKTFPIRVMHPMTMLGNRKLVGYPNLLIFDEAHNLIQMRQDDAGVKLWHFRHRWPMDISTVEDVLGWLERAPKDRDRDKAYKLIMRDPTNVLIERVQLDYFKREEWCLRIVPLTVRNERPILWPRSVKKLVLMSATVGPVDVHELGLDKFGGNGKEVMYHACDSPIPASSREVIYKPLVAMSHDNLENAIPEACDVIKQIADVEPGAGLVHATYAHAAMMREHLTGPRFLWHDHGNKAQVYGDWIAGRAGTGRILVGSGLAEGIDLAGDLCRWQVITKMPSLSLADPAIAIKAERDPDWYSWQTVKGLLQATGRVCRGPDDWGRTYIFDTNFSRLYSEREYMLPFYFKDSIRW